VEAARRLKRMQTADPDWLEHIPARDVQNLFGEPANFAEQLTKLEAQVQAHPEDRDAWLVLGTELFLTGRTQRAADIFTRLTDRKPDALLKTLLEASKAEVQERDE
jgi:cytochrome c-type biogenesis protein CcmH/NrfG